MIIVNTLEDDEKFLFKTQEGDWIEIPKSKASSMVVAYDLLAEMQKPVEAPAPVKKEKKQKKAKPEVVEEKEE
tara:strand:- start:1553 stop:1771 length:219 start_codon:yes stop_codon:yes gene_type:complete